MAFEYHIFKTNYLINHGQEEVEYLQAQDKSGLVTT